MQDGHKNVMQVQHTHVINCAVIQLGTCPTCCPVQSLEVQCMAILGTLNPLYTLFGTPLEALSKKTADTASREQ